MTEQFFSVFRSVMRSARRGEADFLAADAMKDLGGAAAAAKRFTEGAVTEMETPKRVRLGRDLYVP